MSTLTDMVDSYLTPKLKEGETVDLSQFTPRQRTNIRLYGLGFKDYTASDISKYKQEWMKNCEIIPLYSKGHKTWITKFCRKHFYHQDFHIEIDRVFFKNQPDAMVFKLSHKG